MREGQIGAPRRRRRRQSNLSSIEVIKLLNSHRAVIDGDEPRVLVNVCCVCKMEDWLLMVILACHSSKGHLCGPSASCTQPQTHCKCHHYRSVHEFVCVCLCVKVLSCFLLIQFSFRVSLLDILLCVPFVLLCTFTCTLSSLCSLCLYWPGRL